ncbi:hypothetical protein ANO11243_048670 [Dothideomycetidae sp. 11243]|nr:hypothetical protein ANO11243_048670 [fungal sp. No.11243]
MADSTTASSPTLSVNTDSSTTALTAESSLVREVTIQNRLELWLTYRQLHDEVTRGGVHQCGTALQEDHELTADAASNASSVDSGHKKSSASKSVTFAEPAFKTFTPAVDEADPYMIRGDTRFTSDMGISRCIEVKGIPTQEVCQVLMASGHAVEATWVPEHRQQVILVYLNDSRAAEELARNLPGHFPGTSCDFVPTQTIAPVLEHAKLPLATSIFNGQLMVTATWVGDCESANFREVFDECYALALSYGPVRCFALDGHNVQETNFRVEFYTLSSVDEMLMSTGIGKYHAISPKVNAAVTFYQPHGLMARQSSARSAPTYVSVSETGRTALENGRPFPVSGFQEISNTNSHPTRSRSYPYSTFNVAVDAEISGAFRNMSLAGNSQAMVPYHPPSGQFHHPRSFPSSQYREATYLDSPTVMALNERANHRGGLYGSARRNRRSRSDTSHPGQSVEISAIENGTDVRTTLMLRNLPNRLTFWDVKKVLEYSSKGVIDFLYVRVDFGSGLNVGYGFVNFIAPEHIVPFLKTSVGRPWPGFESNKVLEVSYATIQGQECLIQKFRNSSVLRECDGYTPKLFYTIADTTIPQGKVIGDCYTFPEPDNLQKLNRSLDNARTVGLFTTRDARSSRDARRPRSQFDRGTPRAVRDEAMAVARSNGRGRGRDSVGIIGHGPTTPRQSMHGSMTARHDMGPVSAALTPYGHGGRLDARAPGFYPGPVPAFYNPQADSFSPRYGVTSTMCSPTFGGRFNGEGYNSAPSTPRNHYLW